VRWMNRVTDACLSCFHRLPCTRRRSADCSNVRKYPYDKLKVIRAIGNGEYGKVYMAEAPGLRNEASSNIVAVKSSNASSILMMEAETLTRLSHPNIVRLFAVCDVSKTLYQRARRHVIMSSRGNDDAMATLKPPFLLFEYVDNGDLCTYLRTYGKHKDFFAAKQDNTQQQQQENPPVELNLPARLSFCAQIASGMTYLSQKHIVHRDLAARNCLLTRCGRVKISDFGLSRDTNDTDSYSYTTRGVDALPVRWMAPEAFLDGLYSSSSDVWSFGVVVWEIFTDAVQPFFGLPNHQVISNILQGRLLSKPRLSPDWLYEVMLACWNSGVDKRPSFVELDVFFHKFFTQRCEQS